MDGTGRFGSLLHFFHDPAGPSVPKRVTEIYSRADFDFLPPDQVLVTFRGIFFVEFPASCYGCIPSLEQELLRWNGDAFETLGKREIPYPDLTLNRLRQALATGDDVAAEAWVSDPALLAEARRVMIGRPEWFVQYERYESGLLALESTNWSALPAAIQTALPPEMHERTYVIDGPDGRYRLTLKRAPERWLLTNIERE